MKFGFPQLTSGAIALTTALALSGCQLPVPVQTAPAASVSSAATAPMGTVVVDLAAFAKAGATRHVMSDGFRDATIVAYRLTASGPNMQPIATDPVAWTPVVQPGLVLPPTGQITLQVPAGPFRLFTFEGLNAGGEPVATIHSLTPVMANQQTMLIFDWSVDATARVFSEIADLAPDYPANPVVLSVIEDYSTSSITETTLPMGPGLGFSSVLSFVQKCAGLGVVGGGLGGPYGNFAPGRFNAWKYAKKVVEDGAYWMPTDYSLPVPDAMDYETTVTLHASLVDKSGQPTTATSATLTVLDPIPAHAEVSFATEPAVLPDVLPGTWRARVTIEGDSRIVTLKMPHTTATHIDGYVEFPLWSNQESYDVEPDADGDGYPVSRDVDDADPAVHEASTAGDTGIPGADGP